MKITKTSTGRYQAIMSDEQYRGIVGVGGSFAEAIGSLLTIIMQ